MYTGDWPALTHIPRGSWWVGQRIWPIAYICPVCLTNWARLRWSADDRPVIVDADVYHVFGASCPRCNSPSVNAPVVGSIVPYWDLDLIKWLPTDLLIREYILTCKQETTECQSSAPTPDHETGTSLHTDQRLASTEYSTENSVSP